MSVTINVQIEGADKLVRALTKTFPAIFKETVPRNMQSVGILMQREAQLRAPKKTGYMADQIRFEVLPYPGWAFRLIGRAPYTIFQEFGTRYIRPRLFMTQALDSYREQMIGAVRDGVNEAISEIFV
jgi:HK97 gp10 family phage protein